MSSVRTSANGRTGNAAGPRAPWLVSSGLSPHGYACSATSVPSFGSMSAAALFFGGGGGAVITRVPVIVRVPALVIGAMRADVPIVRATGVGVGVGAGALAGAGAGAE